MRRDALLAQPIGAVDTKRGDGGAGVSTCRTPPAVAGGAVAPRVARDPRPRDPTRVQAVDDVAYKAVLFAEWTRHSDISQTCGRGRFMLV